MLNRFKGPNRPGRCNHNADGAALIGAFCTHCSTHRGTSYETKSWHFFFFFFLPSILRNLCARRLPLSPPTQLSGSLLLGPSLCRAWTGRATRYWLQTLFLYLFFVFFFFKWYKISSFVYFLCCHGCFRAEFVRHELTIGRCRSIR